MGLSRTHEGIIKEVKEISELIDKVKYFQFFYNDIKEIYKKLVLIEEEIEHYKKTLSIKKSLQAHFSKANELLDEITTRDYRIEAFKNRIKELKRLLFVPDPSISRGTLGGSRETRKTRKTIKASKSSTKNKTTKKSKKAKALRRRQSRKIKKTKKASKVSTNPKK